MAINSAALLCAASALTLYYGLFAIIVIALPKSATIARSVSVLLMSAAAAFVSRYAIGLVQSLLLRGTLLTCFLVHWLSLIDYISLAKLDSTKLSELITKEKHKAFGEGFNHANRQTATETVFAGTATIGQQVWKALALTTNFRRLGTEWEVKNIIYPQARPTPVGFVLDVLPKVTLSYLLIDAMMHAPPPEPRLITAAKQTSWRLWMLSSEDLVFRVPAVALFWLSARLVIYVLTQGVLGLPSIALGLSSPDYWPSLFGPLRELYTIRGFWGSFWHQCLRRILTSHADFISDFILRLPRGTLVSRYTRIFLAFFISGMVHHAADVMSGLAQNETASLGFFLLQPLGVIMEDAVQALTRNWPMPRMVRTLAGYSWVLFFLVLTTPSWMFPSARLQLGPVLLPFSVVGPWIKSVAPQP